MRVVSLLPSATEILAQLGGLDRLVGRSHECDHPPQVARLPALTAPRPAAKATYDPAAGRDAAAVHRAVAAAQSANAGLYDLNAAALLDLRPDVILTQDLCDVCAISLDTVRGVVRHMRQGFGLRTEVVPLNPATLEAVLDDHLAVARACAIPDAGPRAAVALRERLFRAEEHVPPFAHRPTVGFLEWTDPLFVAGHWTVELIERAGGRHPLNESTAPPADGAALGPQHGARKAGKSIPVPDELFAATKPDYLIICPCGLTLDQAHAEATNLARRARAAGWWDTLPAVRAGRVAIVDGNQMFNRPGPRLFDAFEWLVAWLQDRPELAPPGFPSRPFHAH